MQSKIHPGLCLANERIPMILGLKVSMTRTLDGEVDVPVSMMDAIDEPHPAAGVHLFDFIQVIYDIPDLPSRWHFGLLSHRRSATPMHTPVSDAMLRPRLGTGRVGVATPELHDSLTFQIDADSRTDVPTRGKI